MLLFEDLDLLDERVVNEQQRKALGVGEALGHAQFRQDLFGAFHLKQVGDVVHDDVEEEVQPQTKLMSLLIEEGVEALKSIEQLSEVAARLYYEFLQRLLRQVVFLPNRLEEVRKLLADNSS